MQVKRSCISFILEIFNKCSFPYRFYQQKNKCIFIHIPKVAGTSILYALGKKSGGRDHLPWYVYYTASPKKFAAYFKFCFVRNPWDRVLSAYRYLKNGGNKTSDLSVAKAIISFESFDRFVIDGLGRGYFRSYLLFLPQSYFIIGPTNEVMVDFVGRYENIEEDYKIVADRLDLSKSLPRINVTQETDWNFYREAYCSNESISVIAEIYRQDIISFGYDF